MSGGLLAATVEDAVRFCAFQDLLRLRDERLLCAYSNGPVGGVITRAETRIVQYEPTILMDDFAKGDAKGWFAPTGTWEVVADPQDPGDMDYSGTGPGATVTGLWDWQKYEVSVNLASFSQVPFAKAGIVINRQETPPGNFYYFGVYYGTEGVITGTWAQAWKYREGFSPTTFLLEPVLVTTAQEPIELRVTRFIDPGNQLSFLYYYLLISLFSRKIFMRRAP